MPIKHEFVKRKKAEAVVVEEDKSVAEDAPTLAEKPVETVVPVLLKGNSRTPKNVTRKDIRDLLEADLDRTIGGVKRMDALIARMVTEAIRGNMRAMELTLAYLYGKPQQQQSAPDTGPFVLELSEPTEDEPTNNNETHIQTNSGV